MLLFAITKHCCRSGKISLVEEQQQQDVATGVSCQLPFQLKAVKSVLNYSKSAVRNDRTSICTIRTLIKTTKPTSVPVQRPNSDLLYMPYYELSTLITTPMSYIGAGMNALGPEAWKCELTINKGLQSGFAP